MAVEILMPKLGMTMEEGKLVEWLKGEKDEVQKGELLFVIESDKVTFEVEAPGTGVLTILIHDGEGISIGTLLGYVAETAEEYDQLQGGAGTASPLEAPATRETQGVQAAVETPAAPSDDSGIPGKVRATPAARALAREKNINLTLVAGTGPNGRISRDDVKNAPSRGEGARNTGAAPATPGARKEAKALRVDLASVSGTGVNGTITRRDVIQSSMDQPAAGGIIPELEMINGKRLEKEEPMTSIRATISRRMMESLQQSAQMTAFTEWDVTELMALRKTLNTASYGEAGKVSFPGLMVFFLARVLKEMPIFNASVKGKNIQYWHDANIGVAVSVDDALVVPVVHKADTSSLNDIQVTLNDLIDRARNRALMPDDMAGGTFTLSNVGSYGSEWETVILNPPEVALLGIGSIIKKPVVKDNEIVVRQMMPISLTFDHRVIDGATAGAFRNRMKTLIENPGLLITCFSNKVR